MPLDARLKPIARHIAALPNAESATRRSYEVFRIGNTLEPADEGVTRSG
jgi:hypothetical protein